MKYRLSFNGALSEKSCNALRDRIAMVFERPDVEDLIVLFSSEGGSTVDGISLYNFLKSLPRPIQFHATGHVGSMAVPVFVGAPKRTCSSISRFFFHVYDWGFGARATIDGIEQARKRLTDDIALSRKIVEENTHIPPDRLDVLYGDSPIPTIVSPQEALGLGIVDEVVDLNPTGAPQPGVALWTVNWPP